MTEQEAKQAWERFNALIKPRQERRENPFKSLETAYPFRYVKPFRIAVMQTRAGDVQIQNERFQLNGRRLSNLRHDQKVHPEKPAYQNMRRRYNRERNDIALEQDIAWNGVE